MPKKDGSCIPVRAVLAFLCATGVVELYISKTNLSIAIVAMVQTVSSGVSDANTAIKQPFCLRNNETLIAEHISMLNFTVNTKLFQQSTTPANKKEAEALTSRIKLTTLERGNLLSAFFYAYGLSGIFGGRLAELYGTKKVFGTAVLVDAIGNFLIPFAAKTSYGFLFFIRFVMGIFQGACYPSLHALAAKWFPPKEQPSFVSSVYPANSFGTIFSLTLGGIIISKWGWEASFYISGSLSLLWLIFWIFMAYDTPEQHPRISEAEKEYIASSQIAPKQPKSRRIPLKAMLTSLPLWAINVAHAGAMLGLGFLITQLPTYMSSIIGVNIRNNGLLSSLPFMARFLFGIVFGWASKYTLEKNYMKKRTLKRVLTYIGFGGPAVALLFVGYVGCSTIAATTLFIVAMSLNSATLPGYCCNHLDLTTNYSGTSFGISSMVGFLYAMIGPVVVGALTPEATLEEWKIVYWFVFFNYIISGGFYCILLSTERQWWDRENGNQEQANNIDSYENEKENLAIKTSS